MPPSTPARRRRVAAPRKNWRLAYVALVAASVAGCSPPEKPGSARGSARDAALDAAQAARPAATPPHTQTEAQGLPGLRLLPFEAGTALVEQVRELDASARSDGRRLLVYVGADWCEPCRYFHEAASSGALDEQFPHLDLLEVDFDTHKAELAEAGYSARLLPIFAVPEPSGRASGVLEQGGIKGPRAVDQLRPRLEALLARSERP